MAQQNINIGAVNAKQGDTYFDAFTKIESNFNELYGNIASTPNIITVTQASDIDDLAVSGVVTINSNMTFVLQVPNVQITSRFFLDDSGSERPRLELTGVGAGYALEYIGVAGIFVTGANGDFFCTNLSLVGRTSGSTLLGTEDGVINIEGGVIRLWTDLGTHKRGNIFLRFPRFAAWGAGFKFEDFDTFSAVQPESIFDPAGGILFDTINNLSDDRSIEILGAPGQLQPTSALLRVDPSMRDSSRVKVSGSTLSSGLIYNTTGINGTFTAVANASVTSVNINNVTDVGGLAQFNFTPGPALFVGQQTIHVGFVNDDYNGTITITAVGSGFFRSDSIKFDGNETVGSFTSDSVTLTDTATALSEGDTVNIDTDLSVDYLGGSIVYDKQVNSFRINRPFTVTRSGTWNTAGLDETDNKVLSTNNSGFDNSRAIASAFVNDNTNTVAGAAITNGVYMDFDFGTLTETDKIQRFKLIDASNCTFEYFGNEPFNGKMPYDITSVSTGGAVEFLFKWQKDIGAGFVDLDNNIIRMNEIGGTSAATGGHVVLSIVNGDLIKPVFTRDSGASSFTARYFNCTTTE